MSRARFSARDGISGGPLDEARVRAYWDAMSSRYVPGASRGLVRFSHRRQHEVALRLALLSPGDRVLDAGAGTGLLTRDLVKAGCDVTAVEASAAMAAHLRGVASSVIQARLEDLDLRERFDAVLAVGVLNFVHDPASVLRRLSGLVGPGGRLVVQVTELSFFGEIYARLYHRRGIRPFLFSRRWLIDRAGEAGLDLTGSGHPFPHDLTLAFQRPRA